MKNMFPFDTGFTIVELMIAMVVSMVLVAGIYASYRLQQRTQVGQELLVEMQQNARAARIWLERDLRNAGFDKNPSSGHSSCNAGGSSPVLPGIHTATATILGFSMDLNSDGDCAGIAENLTYNLYEANDGTPSLSRHKPGGDNEAIANNFDAIEFLYTLGDGTVTTTPASSKYSEIRIVEVSLLVRAQKRSPKFDNSAIIYPPASGSADPKWGPFTDGIRRQLVTTGITFRNMGI